MRSMSQRGGFVAAATLVLLVGVGFVARAATDDWNSAGIRWMAYEEGLAAAKTEHKPVCLIFYTTWCPHCTNYEKVFSDPDVVKKAESFIMIKLDKDKNRELSAKHAPDGEYIPRTYFLSPDGELDEELTAERSRFKYFYSESDPTSISAGMDRALERFGKQANTAQP